MISVTSFAQEAVDYTETVTHIRELIKTDPAQATEQIDQLLQGKNKKNVQLKAIAYMLKGDMKLAEEKAGEACQLYEQAIYFDPNCKEAYLRFANAYQYTAPGLAIDKLEELKKIDPNYAPAEQALARIYYRRNEFAKAVEAYAKFIDTPQATEADITQYAFALFLNHEFEKSLDVANKGLQRNSKHAAFNRLVMYNNTDLKRYDEGLKAADAFFNNAEEVDYSYLDYLYYGHLLNHAGQYEQSIEQFTKAMQQDSVKLNLWNEISEAYEKVNKPIDAVEAYDKYLDALPADKQTPDLQLQLGKLYYTEGTSKDSVNITPDDKKLALHQADSVFAIIAQKVPDNYLGTLWRARANSGLDPETTEGLAKPYYEQAIALIEAKHEERLNPILVEAYSYMGYYYMLKTKIPESTEYWNKIIAIDAENATAKKALDGIKKMVAASRQQKK